MNTFSATDVGQRRKINQDYVFASELPVGCLPNLFIVADGMGGHNAGDYASRFVANTVKALIEHEKESGVTEAIERAIKKSNKLLMAEAEKKEELRGMGTTIVVMTIVEDTVYVANVGDSRLYLLRDEDIIQVTEDHSLVEVMVRLGQITKEEAKVHPDKNIITRAIGVGDNVQVDFFEFDWKTGDKILMCSDGLTNMVDDSVIFEIVDSHCTMEERVRELVKTANDNGGKDNIAVILVEPGTNEVKKC